MGFASLYPSYVLAVYSRARPSHNPWMERRQHAPLPINPVGDLLRGWPGQFAFSIRPSSRRFNSAVALSP